MHSRTLILASLLGAFGCAQAAEPECKHQYNGKCVAAAYIPALPAPPAPPALPSSEAMPAPPAPPAPPAAPAPPAPPAPPAIEIPARAHAACAGKAAGSKVTLTLGASESMSGVCQRAHGRMVFRMRSYHRAD